LPGRLTPGAGQDIVCEGERPDAIHLVLDGFACRYKTLSDGRRQIPAHFIRSDFCNLRLFILSEMDHSVVTLTPATIASISHQDLLTLTDRHPRITQALWWSEMVDESITREWLLNLGQRKAIERMAHLICEYFLRMRAVGLSTGYTCELPVTQAEMGDTLGLTNVHVNRTLQELRNRKLIELRGKHLAILDLEALQKLSMFSPYYLNLLHKPRNITANDQARESASN
jgi:CRP-like cAMP-binding protein